MKTIVVRPTALYSCIPANLSITGGALLFEFRGGKNPPQRPDGPDA
jgi:hypothetical protein